MGAIDATWWAMMMMSTQTDSADDNLEQKHGHNSLVDERNLGSSIAQA
jgi:hypothetical protein